MQSSDCLNKLIIFPLIISRECWQVLTPAFFTFMGKNCAILRLTLADTTHRPLTYESTPRTLWVFLSRHASKYCSFHVYVSERVSANTSRDNHPFLTCFPSFATQRGNTRLSHIRDSPLIMSLVAWRILSACQRLAYFILVLSIRFLATLWLAFRLQTSECVYNATNKRVRTFTPQCP